MTLKYNISPKCFCDVYPVTLMSKATFLNQQGMSLLLSHYANNYLIITSRLFKTN